MRKIEPTDAKRAGHPVRIHPPYQSYRARECVSMEEEGQLTETKYALQRGIDCCVE